MNEEIEAELENKIRQLRNLRVGRKKIEVRFQTEIDRLRTLEREQTESRQDAEEKLELEIDLLMTNAGVRHFVGTSGTVSKRVSQGIEVPEDFDPATLPVELTRQQINKQEIKQSVKEKKAFWAPEVDPAFAYLVYEGEAFPSVRRRTKDSISFKMVDTETP